MLINGYKLSVVCANDCGDGIYGDIYTEVEECLREHPNTEILYGFHLEKMELKRRIGSIPPKKLSHGRHAIEHKEENICWLEILFIRIASMQIAITQFTTAAMGNSGAKHPCYSAP